MSKSIKLNMVYKTILNILNIIFPLVTAPYIARVLSIDGFTEYNRAVSILSWLSPFAVFGVYTYGLRSISQIRDNKKSVEKLFTSLFIISAFFSILFTIIYFILIFTNDSFKSHIGIYFFASGQLIFTCFATDWMNEASENYGFITIKSFVCRLLFVISVFCFIKSPDDAWLYMLFSTLSVLLNNTFTFIFNKMHFSFTKVSFHEIISLLKPLFIVFILVNSSLLYTVLDRFFLTYFSDKLQLTYYHLSQVISSCIFQVTSSVILVSVPRLSYLWANNDSKNYYDLLQKSSSLFLSLCFPCCIGVAILAPEILYIYAGEKFFSGNIVLFLFAIYNFIGTFDTIYSKQVLLATGNEACLTRIYYTGGILNLIFKIILLRTDNLTAESCIISTMVADITIEILQIIETKKKGIRNVVLNKTLIVPFVTSLLFIPIILCVKRFFYSMSMYDVLMKCVLSILICSVLYLTMLFLTKNPSLNFLLKGKKNESNF